MKDELYYVSMEILRLKIIEKYFTTKPLLGGTASEFLYPDVNKVSSSFFRNCKYSFDLHILQYFELSESLSPKLFHGIHMKRKYYTVLLLLSFQTKFQCVQNELTLTF